MSLLRTYERTAAASDKWIRFQLELYSQKWRSRFSILGDVLFIRKSLYYFWGGPHEDMEPRTALPTTKSDYGGKRKMLTEAREGGGKGKEPSLLIMSHDCELVQSLR